MKKLKKSTGLTVALLIYVSATAAYFLPRNTEISNTEKYVTVIASYVIVLALWLVVLCVLYWKVWVSQTFWLSQRVLLILTTW